MQEIMLIKDSFAKQNKTTKKDSFASIQNTQKVVDKIQQFF